MSLAWEPRVQNGTSSCRCMCLYVFVCVYVRRCLQAVPLRNSAFPVRRLVDDRERRPARPRRRRRWHGTQELVKSGLLGFCCQNGYGLLCNRRDPPPPLVASSCRRCLSCLYLVSSNSFIIDYYYLLLVSCRRCHNCDHDHHHPCHKLAQCGYFARFDYLA